MENLNAEQVKTALGDCLAGDCEPCAYRKIFDCRDSMCFDALALINSQEQRIGELEKRLRYLLQSKTIAEYDEVDIRTKEYVKDIHSLDANIKELTEENAEVKANWQKLKDSHESACEECRAEFKRLTEENEEYLDTIASLEIYLENAKANTVREMQERLDKHFCHDPAFLGVEQRLIMGAIDQIAKEMLGGEK